MQAADVYLARVVDTQRRRHHSVRTRVPNFPLSYKFVLSGQKRELTAFSPMSKHEKSKGKRSGDHDCSFELKKAKVRRCGKARRWYNSDDKSCQIWTFPEAREEHVTLRQEKKTLLLEFFTHPLRRCRSLLV